MLHTISMKLLMLSTALFTVAVMALSPVIASASVVLDPFTPSEVGTWTADRTFPSGGVNSVSFAGRDDVLEMRIDKDLRSTLGGFYYTEGVKKESNFGSELSVDLYVDGDWETKDVRAGLWGVAVNGSSSITSYPIVEFSTARSDGSTGWRVWDVNQWVNLDTDYSFDSWNDLTLTIEDDKIIFRINGEEVGTTVSNNSVEFDAVILNAFNYGSEAESYKVHWHIGIPFERSLEITKPVSDGEAVSGTVEFEAIYVDEDGDDDLAWAVRSGTCAPNDTFTVAGNVGAFAGTNASAFSWEEGVFTSSVDMSGLPDGDYCFIMNPLDDPDEENLRETRWFTLLNDPSEKTQCMKGGWEEYGFKNQGQCVRFVETGKDSR